MPVVPAEPIVNTVHLEDLLARYFELRDAGSAPQPEDLTTDTAIQDALRCLIDAASAMERDPLLASPAAGRSESSSTPGLPAPPGYRVVEKIAQGGMGEIYSAVDTVFEREVAIKVLRPGDPHRRASAAARFAAEARLTGRIEHPGVPPVHAFGTLADGGPYLVMKLIRGETLARLLADRAGLADHLPRFVATIEQVCQAVGFAHSLGIIHRDLKPSNVMVGKFGEVQVMDWGLAKDLTLADPSDLSPDAEAGVDSREPSTSAPPIQTGPGMILGTPAYMAPEQAKGEPTDARTDVFALGGLLCAVLTGEPTFAEPNVARALGRAIDGDLTNALARLDACGADADLVSLARRCLAPCPADRPANGKEVADAIAAYRSSREDLIHQAERDLAAAKARATEAENTQREVEARMAESRKRRRSQQGLQASLGLLAMGVLGFFWWAEHKNAQERAQQAASQVASSQAAIGLAFQRGDLASVIQVFDAAVANGLPVTPAMRLARARSLANLSEVTPALEELRRLDTPSLPLELRSQVDLLTGALLLGTADEPRGLTLIRQASAPGSRLSEADVEYARGLIAPDVREAIPHFRKAIDLEPAHLDARAMACVTLLASGHLADLSLLASESHPLSPSHPIFPLVLTIGHALQGNKDESARWIKKLQTIVRDPADTPLLTAVVEELPLLMEVLLEIRSVNNSGISVGPIIPPRLAIFMIGRLPVLIGQFKKSGGEGGMMVGLRLPPATRNILRMVWVELMGLNARLGASFPELPFLSLLAGGRQPTLKFTDAAGEAIARQQIEANPEGTLAFIFGYSKMGQAWESNRANAPDWRDRMAEAGAALKAASQTPGMFGLEEVSLDLAILYYVQAGFDKVGEPARPEFSKLASDLVRLRLSRPGSIPNQSRPSHFYAARDAHDFGLAHFTLEEWRRSSPEDPNLVTSGIWLDRLTGNDARALSVAEAVLAKNPDESTLLNREMRDHRDQCRQKLGLTPITSGTPGPKPK